MMPLVLINFLFWLPHYAKIFWIPAVLILTGGLLNTLVVIINGGRMPAKIEAIEQHGAPITDNTRLAFLGDIFMFETKGREYFYSLGDVLVTFGIIMFCTVETYALVV
jgi:hypothetical protein